MTKLSNEELIGLIQADIDTKENTLTLYNQNRGFIYNIVNKYVYGIYEIEDLMQQAFIGLTKAIEYHNAELEETNFLEILKLCIKNCIRELKGTLPAHLKQKIYNFKQIQKELIQINGEIPTDKEMMLYMNIDKKALDYIKTGIALTSISSIDEPLNEETETTKKDLLVDNNADYTKAIEDMELKIIILKAVDFLQGMEKQIITERYIKNRTIKSIGNEFNCDSSYIIKIERKALRKLRYNKQIMKNLEGYISPPSTYNRNIESIVMKNIDIEELYHFTHPKK